MVGWLEFLRLVMAALQPSSSDDPRVQLAWRKTMAFAMMGVIAVGVFSFVWAQGKIPGLSGVALADDLSAMKTEIGKRQDQSDADLTDIRLTLVRNSIKQALRDRCNAHAANNQAAMDAANNDLDIFFEQYRMLTHGHDWEPMPCNVILISGPQ